MSALLPARFRGAFGLLLCAGAMASPAVSEAAQVRGTVEAPAEQSATSYTLGYTRSRVATRAAPRPANTGPDRGSVAVFLAAKESGVIAAPTEPYKVDIAGLALEPSVAACAIDGKVAFTNLDRSSMTVEIDGQALAPIGPNQTVTYECKGEPNTRKVRIKEWPHVRGALYVGEVGVGASVNANGVFSLTAPQGKYELRLIGEGGPYFTRPVDVKTVDLELGKVAAPAAAAAEGAVRDSVEPVPPVERQPPPEPAVKKEPVKKEPVAPPTKKKELSDRPSTDEEELEFDEQ